MSDDKGQEKTGWFSRLKKGLSKSTSSISTGITDIFTKRKLDDLALEELEDLLITADVGVDMASRVAERLRKTRFEKNVDADEIRKVLAEEVEAILEPVARPLDIARASTPQVVLVIGVNGSGKTTTIGKIASQLKAQGRSVMLAAGDTFRAAAIEQLQIWGERVGIPVITRPAGSDAASLAWEAMDQAARQNADVLIIDTAGRLQNRLELMDELAKVIRVINKKDEGAPHHTLLVLDATTGQNALSQVKIFGEMAAVTGLIVTKLDGSAKAGILVACAEKYGLPIHAVGVGEEIDDLHPFDAGQFARVLTGFESYKE